ncbi:hypothetical protein DCS_05869 [Drechmeria coniospora]|uniref:Enterotoxin n=1 Tax=Drechmeria coniospora TaxID=98403 RepID=A0A151GP63_DRECN|nr:hypothetical protein DCS_05869 [Drechmeria coniospora]KYK58851.1 hypothetical protein DCS_05869 [Drechmeria coniospora]
MHPSSSFLVTALLLFQWTSIGFATLPGEPISGDAVEPSSSETVRTDIVSRSDFRSPDEVKAHGGFQPVGTLKRTPENIMAGGASASLYNHMCGGAQPKFSQPTLYVSTSRSQIAAERFLGTKPGYLYRIHATANFIHQPKSLGKWLFFTDFMTLEDIHIAHEDEYSALGGIRWPQVMGYTYLAQGVKTPEAERVYVENKDYNPFYDQFFATEDYPKLAGFPVNHPAWREPRYSQYDPSKTLQYAVEFMEAYGSPVQWRHGFPLIVSPQDAMNAAAEIANLALSITEVMKTLENPSSYGDQKTKNKNSLKGAEPTIEWTIKVGNEAIDKVLDASYRISRLIKVVGQVVQDTPYIDRSIFDEAWVSTVNAKINVAQVRGAAWMQGATKLKQQVLNDKANIHNSNIQGVTTKLELYTDMARGKLNQMVKSRAMLSEKLMQAETSLQDQEKSRIIWLGLPREGIATAITREVELLSKVVAIYQEFYKNLKKILDEVKGIGDEISDEMKRQELKTAKTQEEAKKAQERLGTEQKAITDAKLRLMETVREAEKLHDQAPPGSWMDKALIGLGGSIVTLAASGLITLAVSTGTIGAGTSAAGAAGASTLGEGFSAIVIGQSADVAAEKAAEVLEEAIKRNVQSTASKEDLASTSVERRAVFSQKSAKKQMEPAQKHRRGEANSIDKLVDEQGDLQNVRLLTILAIMPLVERVVDSALMATWDEAWLELGL